MTALNIQNPEGLITRTINQAKAKGLMLRELVQNALEATSKQTSGTKTIKIQKTDPAWFGLTNYSKNKLGIYNTGPGMNAVNLRKATDLSSSIGKSQGIHGNFGIGAKVSTLAVNKAGVIWVSCYDKKVHMVVLRLSTDPLTGEPRYERQDFDDNNGGTTDVVEITHLFDGTVSNFRNEIDENFKLLDYTHDWTYITLCGNDPNQNTIENPYDETKISQGWVLNEIYKRFAKIPADVDFRSEFHGQTKDDKNKIFKSVFEVIEWRAKERPDQVQYETVSTDSGIDVTYVYDGPWGVKNDQNDRQPTTVRHNPAPCGIFSALVFKDEMYDIRGGGFRNEGRHWQPAAKECGIIYGYDYLRVFVHLPATENIIPDQYRIRLQHNTSGKEEIEFTDYKALIWHNMPTWFKEKMNQFAPKPVDMNKIRDELQNLMDRLNVNTTAAPNHTSGSGKGSGNNSLSSGTTGTPGGGAGNNNGSGTNKGKIPGLNPNLFGNKQIKKIFPEIKILKTESEIANAAVCPTFINKAAEYVEDGDSTLFINGTYSAVVDFKNDLLSSYQTHSNFAEIENKADTIATNRITKLIGIGLVHSLIKKGKPGFTEDFEKLIDPACLTIHADNWIENINDDKRELEKQVKQLDLENVNQSKVTSSLDTILEVA